VPPTLVVEMLCQSQEFTRARGVPWDVSLRDVQCWIDLVFWFEDHLMQRESRQPQRPLSY